MAIAKTHFSLSYNVLKNALIWIIVKCLKEESYF